MRQDWVDGVLIIIFFLIPTQYNVFNANVFVMVYLAVFFFSYLDINMIVRNVLVFIHVCHAETTGTGDTKKNIYPSKPVYDLKKFYLYFFIFFFL